MKNRFMKKAAAIALAAVMGTTAASSAVMASCTSFTECGKTHIAEKSAEIAAGWDEFLTAYKTALNEDSGAQADYYITLGDGAKQLISMFTGFDLSWFQSVEMVQVESMSVTNNKMYAEFEILLNDTSLATLNFLMDLETSVAYMQVPEISESWFMVDYNVIMQQAGADMGISIGQMVDIIKSIIASLPDGTTLTNLMNRYFGIVYDHANNAEPTTATLTAGGISEEVTVLGATYGVAEIGNMMIDLISTFKEDEEIKGIVENITGLFGEAGAGIYEQIISSMDQLSADITESLGDLSALPSDAMTCELYENADDEVIGALVNLDVENQSGGFCFYTTDDGEQKGLQIEGMFEDYYVSLSGTGAETDGLFDGTYTLSLNDTAIAQINVYDSALYENDDTVFSCCEISILPQEAPQAEEGAENAYDPMAQVRQVLNMLSSYSLLIAADKNTSFEHQDILISAFSGGTELASISVMVDVSEGPAIPDVASLGTIVDINDQSNMENVQADLMNNLPALLEKLTSAGVPQELINSVMGVESAEEPVA